MFCWKNEIRDSTLLKPPHPHNMLWARRWRGLHQSALMAAAALLLVPLLLPHPARACTSVIVGRKASDDGSIYLARNGDDSRGANNTKNLYWHAPRSGSAAFASNEADNFTLVLPGPGLGYFAFPKHPADPSQGKNASFEVSGINTAGVSVSSTETIESSEAAQAADPLVPGTGLAEDQILSVVVPQPGSTTARGAVRVLGNLIQERGSAEGFGILFSDADEAWYLENAAGHGWLAQRIPDDKFFVTANQGRFTTVDLKDSENVMHSPRLKQFAIENGLWNETNGPFNFFQAYTYNDDFSKDQNYVRVCAITQMLTSTNLTDCLDHMPLDLPTFQEPKRKIGVLDVMDSMRDYFEGTEHDAYTNQNAVEDWRPIFVLRTSMSHVTRTRRGLPDGLSVVNYVSMGPPALSPFVPVYKGLRPADYPKPLTSAGPSPDPISLFWKGRRVHALVLQNFRVLAPPVQAAIRSFERKVEATLRPEMEEAYAGAVEAGDEDLAAQLLADFTAGVVDQACQLMEEQALQAAQALGMQELPPDAMLYHMIDAVTDWMGLHGPHGFEG